jgi:hypothetical protein
MLQLRCVHEHQTLLVAVQSQVHNVYFIFLLDEIDTFSRESKWLAKSSFRPTFSVENAYVF